MRKQLLILPALILLTLLAGNIAFADSITLTGNGLGLSEGNYGSSLAVSDDLTLLAITRIGQTDWNGGLGVPGTIFVHQTDGIGVKGVDISKSGEEKIGGSKEISGEGKHADEAIIFDYSIDVVPNSIRLGLNKIDFAPDQVTLLIDVFSGSVITIPETSIELNFIFTGKEIGYLNFRDLTEISGVNSLSAFTVRAWDGHFFVNSIDYTPVPVPATILLFGTGLISLAGIGRKKFRKN